MKYNYLSGLIAIVLCFIFINQALAETIILKSGETIEAPILEKTDDSVKVDLYGVPITYYLEDIESIDGKIIDQPTQQEVVIDSKEDSDELEIWLESFEAYFEQIIPFIDDYQARDVKSSDAEYLVFVEHIRSLIPPQGLELFHDKLIELSELTAGTTAQEKEQFDYLDKYILSSSILVEALEELLRVIKEKKAPATEIVSVSESIDTLKADIWKANYFQDRPYVYELFKKSADAMSKGDYDQLINLSLEGLTADPGNVIFHYNIAIAYHEGRTDYDSAMYHYKKVLEFNDTPDEWRAQIYYRLGDIYKNLGNYQEAVYYLNESIAIKPFISSYQQLFLIYSAQRDIERTEQTFEKIIEFDPNAADAYYGLGRFYQIMVKDFDKAKKYLQKAKEMYESQGYTERAQRCDSDLKQIPF